MLNFDWFAWMSPGQAKAVFLLFFAAIGVLVGLADRRTARPRRRQTDAWLDLRMWTAALLAMIIMVYLYF